MSPIEFQKCQFSLVFCYDYKQKSRTNHILCWIFFFQKPNFSHGLFYIIVSKVKNKSGLEITICDKH